MAPESVADVFSRREYLRAGLVATLVSGSGCFAANDGEPGRLTVAGDDDSGGPFPVRDLPAYAAWIPATAHDSEPEVYFTHVDWETIGALEPEDEPDEDDLDVIREAPILGLPLIGAVLSGLAFFGIIFYPFTGDLHRDDEDGSGIEMHRMTWADDVLTFHGSFDPDVFDEQYSEAFEVTDEPDGFTIYAGTEDGTEEMAYAVSTDVLVVGMLPGEDEYDTEAVVTDAVMRYVDEADRIIDEDNGRWLLETTGDAQLGVGAWQVDDLREAIDPPEDDEAAGERMPDVDAALEEYPVFDDAEHLVNTVTFAVDEGEMTDLEAQFAGIYPDDAVPTESELEDQLLGTAEPSDIVIEDRRVYVAATFDDIPE